jgi:predicted hotdog family 3-hydroxylacyl-ACP dehydratase
MKPPPPIEEILPHRGGMLLVERLVSWDERQATVSAVPSASAWYAEPAGMPSRVGIELIAQAIGAHVGVVAWSKGEPPKRGVLLGARSYRSQRAHFPAGAALSITATRDFVDASGMGAYDGSIAIDDAEVAAARIVVYQPDDFEAFLARSRGP